MSASALTTAKNEEFVMISLNLSQRLSGVPVLALGSVVVAWGGVLWASGLAAPAQPAEPVRIEVQMNEYSFAPEPLRIPAGRPVTLVIRNRGKIPHEFMAGREPHQGAFEQDLFADVQVGIQKQAAASGRSAGASSTRPKEEAGHGAEHAAGGGHGGAKPHGTMVEAEAGDTYLMTFTLPVTRRGEWMSGCFLEKHFEKGMRGKVIVE
ncbi:MAG: cupredoxin domain-containing protein [Cyanobacteria bacterium]|nr:cupredoxin domain-containing protein [Cyanobacteriota bacterium]